jgi:hypothetical protein
MKVKSDSEVGLIGMKNRLGMYPNFVFTDDAGTDYKMK